VKSLSASDELLYKVALSFLPDVGDIKAKALVAYCGSPAAVFFEKRKMLEKIPGIGSITAKAIKDAEVFERAEEEIRFAKRYKISILSYLDEEYPARLKQCEDAPVLLYYKGNANLNRSRIIAVVGSRKATDYGKEICAKIIEEIAMHHPLVVSGMAYGIDVCAHRCSLKLGLPTIGVLAHGLDMLYPSQHRATAEKMLEEGGLLTEFPSGTKLHPDFFPKRNRIIAGMADAVVVAEASMRSGTLVTATLANDYNRDVFAVPGRIGDPASEGCNHLIKTNKAALLQSGKDIEYIMGWEQNGKKQVQFSLFEDLSKEEQVIANALRANGQQHVDDLSHSTQFPTGKVLSLLLEMEFKGAVRSLPGKIYAMRN